MKALIIKELNSRPVFEELSPAPPLETDAQVTLKASALNHRDLFITKGLYAGIKVPCILGSDGAGIWNEQRVLIYPALEWGDSKAFQGKHFRVLGMPEHGTFAEQITISRTNIFPLPTHLSWEEGAALPLAGLTAWRTLISRCQLQKGERVLITGIGGGVALMAMQFALASGAEVFVSSGSQQKIDKAKSLGASDGVNYRQEDWDKQLKQRAGGGFDVVIDSAGGNGFALFPGLCNPGARIGFYGGTLGKVNGLSLQPIFWKQISLLGSTMGSPEEFAAMLHFVQEHKIYPVIDTVIPLSQGNAAFDRMEEGSQFGKIVLQH